MVVKAREHTHPTHFIPVVGFYFKRAFPLCTGWSDFSCGMIWLANQSVVFLKWKQACGCSALQAAIQLSNGWNDMVIFWCQNIKSPKATQNIIWPMTKVPYPCKFHVYVTNNIELETVLWIHSIRNIAIDKNLNESGEELLKSLTHGL